MPEEQQVLSPLETLTGIERALLAAQRNKRKRRVAVHKGNEAVAGPEVIDKQLPLHKKWIKAMSLHLINRALGCDMQEIQPSWTFSEWTKVKLVQSWI